MNKATLILSAILLTACSQFAPFEDMRREAGQIQSVGQSTNDKPAICYNPIWHDENQAQSLANEACARTNRKAVYVDQKAFSCRLFTPTTVFYQCQ